MKYTLKASLYLLARVILVCILSFLSIPMASIAPGIFRPILGIFYFSIMLYFFVFTMWYEGGKDINRINTEMVNKNLGKGFISASILTIPLCIINIVPLFFPSDLKNIFVTIFGVLKIIFSMSNIFTIQIFINNDVDITQGVGANPESSLIATIVYCSVMLICTIGAGIGYIIGFKQIPILKPWLNKWKD